MLPVRLKIQAKDAGWRWSSRLRGWRQRSQLISRVIRRFPAPRSDRASLRDTRGFMDHGVQHGQSRFFCAGQ